MCTDLDGVVGLFSPSNERRDFTSLLFNMSPFDLEIGKLQWGDENLHEKVGNLMDETDELLKRGREIDAISTLTSLDSKLTQLHDNCMEQFFRDNDPNSSHTMCSEVFGLKLSIESALSYLTESDIGVNGTIFNKSGPNFLVTNTGTVLDGKLIELSTNGSDLDPATIKMIINHVAGMVKKDPTTINIQDQEGDYYGSIDTIGGINFIPADVEIVMISVWLPRPAASPLK